MALLTLGLNHTTAPLSLREKIAFPTVEAVGAALADLRRHMRSLAPEATILSTCNRT
ncbi:MAG: glutamyl-tRNA reductase, partial [Lautropia sp.]|nr:glutamyl-tRNA reductase [Lautropia sp.]